VKGSDLKTILVTGGNGLLGIKLLAEAEGKCRLASVDLQTGPLFPFSGMEYVQADITDAESLRAAAIRTRPDCVIHAAAYTDVDRCEREREACRRVNATGTENMASFCRSQGIKLIYLSTDYIFDGKQGPYSEEDEPHPVSHYGMTKLEGETAVRRLLEDYIIARTTVLYGYFAGIRPNFVTWLVDKLRKKETVFIVDDQHGTPTLAEDLAGMLLVLFENNRRGIYNAVGNECLSRHEFAVRTAEVFGLDASLIRKTTTDRLNQPAARPMRGGLSIQKIIRDTGRAGLSVKEGLKAVRRQMEADGAFTSESGAAVVPH
jgi:dTDP-4-dehydrorhamnose reductase